MRCFLTVLILTFSTGSFAQNIITIAGNGTAGFAGDGGLAINATVNNPHGIDVDQAGNIYIADLLNHRVRMINLNGIIQTVAGNGTPGYTGDSSLAVNAQLYRPYTVKCHKGNVYISEASRIRMVNQEGIITTIAGKNISGFGGDGGPATSATLNEASGMVFDANDNLIFCDQFNHRIRKIDAVTGVITTIAGNGSPGFSGDNGPAIAARFFYPNYLSIDTAGNLYVSDNSNHRIRKINTAGVITTFSGNGTGSYGGNGIAAVAASLYYPAGTVADDSGNIYIADYFNHRIRKVNTSGIISDYAGTGTAGFSGDGIPALNTALNHVVDVKLDLQGNLLLVDYMNNRIRKIVHPTSVTPLDKTKEITVYPNPSSNGIFTVTSSEKGALVIFSVSGSVVGTYTLNEGTNDIRLPDNMAKGMYIAKYLSEDGKTVSSLKLIFES